MRIIILAAGEGSRLMPYTKNKPKCMVEIFGKPIIEYQLDIFKNLKLNDITIIGGYKCKKINYPNIRLIENSNFKKTNMVYSLMCARDLLDGSDDVIITYGDIIFENKVFKSIYNSKFDFSTTIDKDWINLWSLRMSNPLNDAETLKISNGKIIEIGEKPKNFEEIEGQYMGLIKVKASKVKELVRHWDLLNDNTFSKQNINNMFFTSFLQNLINAGYDIHSIPISNGWLEIDTIEDLNNYEKLYSLEKLKYIFKK